MSIFLNTVMEETMQSNWCSVFKNTMDLIQNYSNNQYYVDEHVMNNHVSTDQQNTTCSYPASSASLTYSHLSTPDEVHSARKSVVTGGGQEHKNIQNIKAKNGTGHVSFYSKNILKATFDKIQENRVTSSNDKNKPGEQNINSQDYENCKRWESSSNALEHSPVMDPKTSSLHVDIANSKPCNASTQQELISAYQQGSDSQQFVNSAFHQGNSTSQQGNSTFHQGNSAFHQGNSTFHQGNSTFHQGNSAQGTQHVSSSDHHDLQRHINSSGHQENSVQFQDNNYHYRNDTQGSGSCHQNINMSQQVKHHAIASQHRDSAAFQRMTNSQHDVNSVSYPPHSYCNGGMEQNAFNVWQGANDTRGFHMNSSVDQQAALYSQLQTPTSQNGTPELYQVNSLPNGQRFTHGGVSRSQTRKRRIDGEMQTYSMPSQRSNRNDDLVSHDDVSGHSLTESINQNNSTLYQSPQAYSTNSANLQHTPHPEHVAGRFVRRKRQLCNRKSGARTNNNTSNSINQTDSEIKNPLNMSNDTPSTTANNADGHVQPACLWQPWL